MTRRRATTPLGRAALALTFVAAALAGSGIALAAFSNATSNPGNSFQAATLDPPANLGVIETCGGGGIELQAASSAGADSSPLTIGKPAGVTAGDLLIASVVTRVDTDNPTAPSGWTLIRNDTNGIRQKLWYKVAGAGEPSSYSFSGTGRSAGGILAYSGVDTANPIDVQGVQTASSSTITAPSVTTTVPNTTLVAFFSIRHKLSFTFPASMTGRVSQISAGGGGDDHHVRAAAADQAFAGPGATGSRQATSALSSPNIGVMLALRPLPADWDASLSWEVTPTTWAEGYRLERWVGGSLQSTQTVTPRTTTLVEDGPLVANTAYTFKLKAAYMSWRSTEITKSLTTTAFCGGGSPPVAPSELVATSISSSRIDLSWRDNAAQEQGFKIERSPAGAGAWTEIATVGANVESYPNTGLSADTSYDYRVRAYNANGNSAYSNVASATTASTPPAAPTGLIATAVSEGQIDLTWTDNASNEQGFKIERSPGGAGTWTEVDTVAANVTAYQSTGLSEGTTYDYRVRAYNSAGNSAYSNVASATTSWTPPAAPTGLTATAITASRIDLSWTDTSSNEQGFKIERSPAGAGTWTQIDTVAANVTAYQSTGLSENTAYDYRVRAFNGGFDSAYSNVASATTPTLPAAPSGLTATPVSSSRIDLAWTDNASDESGFKIERSPAGAGTWSQIDTVGANVTSYQSTGLTASTSYDYRVRAYSGAGDSAYSNTASATTHLSPPTGLSATTVNAVRIDLAWTDTSSSELGFKIERSPAGAGTWTQIDTVGANVTSYQSTGLSPSTAYDYRVRAYNAAGNSDYSNVASATTQSGEILVDNTASGSVDGTSLSWSHTVGSGTDRILVVGVSLRKNDRSVSSITYGGVGGFTQAGVQHGPGADHRVEIWYKLMPPVGTATVQVTLTGTVDAVGGSASFTGVHQTTPLGTLVGAGADSIDPSVAVTSAPGELVLGVLSINADVSTLTPGSGLTQRWDGSSGTGDGDGRGVGVTRPGASSVTVAWTATKEKWALAAVPLKPSVVVAPAAPSGLGTTVLSNSEIDLAWTDNSFNEAGFKVERSPAGAGTWTQIGTVGQNATTYRDSGLSPSTAYDYRVRAHNTTGDSPYSNVASATTDPPSSGQILVDSSTSGAVDGSSVSWSHTVGPGSDRILVVGVSLRKNDRSVSSITYGGVGGFTQAGVQHGPGADHRVEIWYKLMPPVGTATVQVTTTATTDIVAGSVSFTGVHQTTPMGTMAGAGADSIDPSVTVSSAPGELVLGVLSINADVSTLTPGPGMTQRWSNSSGTGDGDDRGVGVTKDGASSVTISWTATKEKWALAAVPLKPA